MPLIFLFSNVGFNLVRPDELSDEVFEVELARNCLLNMG